MNRVYDFINRVSGINLNEAHRNFVAVFVKHRLQELNLSMEQYLLLLDNDRKEKTALIDEAAVNETYFFREEQQFDYLKEMWSQDPSAVNIWCAACSTGEEAVSLAMLAESLNKSYSLTATDIDSQALMKFRMKRWGKNSFRDDGKKYWQLLTIGGKLEDNIFTMEESGLKNLSIDNLNLLSEEPYPFAPGSLDLIFLRNAFIYFSEENRQLIISRMEKLLSDKGCIFLSINEIASFDPPKDSSLEKVHEGKIYFLRKKQAKNSRKDRKSIFHEVKGSNDAGKVSFREQNKADDKETAAATAITMEKHLTLEELCTEVLGKLNKGFTEEAENLLKNFDFRPENSEFKWYFEGLIAKEERDEARALNCFNRSALYNSSFWPSTLQIGLIQASRNNQREMKKAFTACQNALSSYIKDKKVCYNLLMEQFSPEYFLNLCTTYLSR